MTTCATCARRTAYPATDQTVTNKPLYSCVWLNRTSGIEIRGAHAPWIYVRSDFGCRGWKQRKAKVKEAA